MNQLQAIAMSEGVRLRKRLWSGTGRAKLESLELAPWAAQRRKDLPELLGVEGNGGAIYFGGFNGILRSEADAVGGKRHDWARRSGATGRAIGWS